MGKRSRDRARAATPAESPTGSPTGTLTGEVGPRQPCPCGSGRRYKNCHGSERGAAGVLVRRPFAGLRAECDLIALRELVPAATAPLRLADGAVPDDRAVRLCSLLPAAAPALVRDDGSIWLGLQVQHAFGDPSRELAAVLLKAYDAEPGSLVGLTEAPGEGPRLQDLLADAPLEVEVHDGFDFWLSDVDDPDGALAATLEQANGAAAPTARLLSVDAAYWTDVGTKEHLRWVMPHDEDRLLDALARLHAAGEDRLTPDSRLVGMFRTHGVLVPVWDLPSGTGAEALEEPAAALADRLAELLAQEGTALTPEERSARSGLANRQVTIR
jgi:hypothetical protein